MGIRPELRPWLIRALLMMIVAFGAYVRLVNLRDNPGWYSDEGSDLEMAAHLAYGRGQYYAIGGATFITGHLPLFHLLAAGLVRLLGRDILAVRLPAALSGVLALPLLYLVGREMIGEGVGLLAAGLFALYPNAVLYNRFGFSYNLLQPLYLLVLYALHRSLQGEGTRWVALAGLSSGLALGTSLVAAPLLAVVAAALALKHRWRGLRTVLLLASLPLSAYALVMLLSAPEAFLYDIAFTLGRARRSLPLQLAAVTVHYFSFWEWDFWHPLGLAGLFLIPRRRARGMLLATTFFSLFWVLRVEALSHLGFYRALGLLPLVALGMAVLLARGLPWLLPRLQEDLQHLPWPRLTTTLTAVTVFFCLLSPLLISAYWDVHRAHIGFPTRLGGTVVQEPQDARQAAAYVNAHTDSDDLVLASPHIAWLMHAWVADFQQSLASRGVATEHFPGDLPRSRWVYDPWYRKARFVVVDDLWRGWASQTMPEVADMLQEIQQWPLAARFGEFAVYRNPEAK
ncbi:MAG: ArnT family glycosyltransferase [Anaerolineae bacterium]